MKVLVAVASRHGSTREMAHVIADELRAAGLDVDCQEAQEVTDVAGYDAAVIGSAVYMGSWQPDALRLVERHREGLAGIPVWLFSSGPLGPDDPRFRPRQVPDLMQATHARDHRIFPGRLEARTLSLGERLAVRAVRAPAGDLRDWAAVRGWAREIAATLGVP